MKISKFALIKDLNVLLIMHANVLNYAAVNTLLLPFTTNTTSLMQKKEKCNSETPMLGSLLQVASPKLSNSHGFT